MHKSDEIEKLAAAVCKLQQEVKDAKATADNPFFHSKYADLKTVLDAVRKPLADNELALIQFPVSRSDGAGVLNVLLHSSGQYIAEDVILSVVKNDPQGMGSAITYARRYSIQAIAGIATEDDDANEASQPQQKANGGRHYQTRPYEEETGKGDPKVDGDLVELKAFLTEEKIPDSFLLTLLQEKGMIDGHTKTVAGLKPGVLRRCLIPKTKANLLAAWKHYKAEDAKREKEPKEEVRTREGDQTRAGIRKPITGIDPKDTLENEGVPNWREVTIHFGKQEGEALGTISAKSLRFWMEEWVPKTYRGKWQPEVILLDAALCLASAELGGAE